MLRDDRVPPEGTASDLKAGDMATGVGNPTLPNDPELAALIDSLARAGSTARRRAGSVEPTQEFAASLRSRLQAALGSVAPGPRSWLLIGPRDRGPDAQTAPEPASASAAIGGEAAAADGGDRTVGPADRVPARGGVVVRPRFGIAARWLPLGAAAVLLVGLVGVWARQTPPTATYQAVDVGSATLVRDGTAAPLSSGTALVAGDEIVVAPGGRATLELGPVIARLGGETTVRIVALDVGQVRIDQLAGRVYHRLAGDVRYEVETGPVTWIADGTAFDLDRGVDAGRPFARLVAVEHEVRAEGRVELVVDEGNVASIVFDPFAAAVRAARPADLLEPWLVANVRLDRKLGFALGVFAHLDDEADASPSPKETTPTHEASPAPWPDPEASPEPTPASTATPKPTPASTATPKPTPKPTLAPAASPKPTATPTPSIDLMLASCEGGVVIEWSKYRGELFNHYSTYRSTSPFEVPERYPPAWPIEYLEASYTTNYRATSAADTTGEVGRRYYYRALVFDAADRVIAASALGSAKADPVRDLGTVGLAAVDGGTQVSWSAYPGLRACFTSYVVVWSKSSSAPSYFGSHDGLIEIGTKSTTSAVVAGLESGTRYWLRVQVVRTTALGTFIVAESAVAEYDVP